MQSFKIKTTTLIIAMAIMFTAACSNNDSTVESPRPTDQQEQINVLKYGDALLGDDIESADITDFYEMLFDGSMKSMEYTYFKMGTTSYHNNCGTPSGDIGINVHCNDGCKIIKYGRSYYHWKYRYILNEELTNDGIVCFDVYAYSWDGIVDINKLLPTFIHRCFFNKESDGRIYREVYTSELITGGYKSGEYTEMHRNKPEDRAFEINEGTLYEYGVYLGGNQKWIKQNDGTRLIIYENEIVVHNAIEIEWSGYFVENVVIKKITMK